MKRYRFAVFIILIVLFSKLDTQFLEDDSSKIPVKINILPGNISTEKCFEYGEHVYIYRRPPVLLINPVKVKINSCGMSALTLIIGGQNAKEREFPHMALLGFRNDTNIEWKCSGNLISEFYILTAAHCTSARGLGKVVWVRLGSLTRNGDKNHKDYAVSNIVEHPDYRAPKVYNDIALLKLNRPVEFNEWIRPACLHVNKNEMFYKYIASGWGITNEGNISETLMKVELDELEYEKCKTYIPLNRHSSNGLDPRTQICAGGRGRDTCQGDSGGPIQVYHPSIHCMYNIVGITSFGPYNCGKFAVYTRVSHYIEWIESIVWS